MSVFGDTIWHPTLKRGRARLFKEVEFWLSVLVNIRVRTVRKWEEKNNFSMDVKENVLLLEEDVRDDEAELWSWFAVFKRS